MQIIMKIHMLTQWYSQIHTQKSETDTVLANKVSTTGGVISSNLTINGNLGS